MSGPEEIATASLVVAICALLVAVSGMVLQYLDYFDRRKEKEPLVELESFREAVPELNTFWTIRVRARRRLEHVRVHFDGLPLKAFYGPNRILEVVLIVKGGAENFRVPVTSPMTADSKVIVFDGSEIIEERKWGSIPQTSP